MQERKWSSAFPGAPPTRAERRSWFSRKLAAQGMKQETGHELRHLANSNSRGRRPSTSCAQGIAGLIGVQPDMIVVGEASNGREAIQQFRMHHPDVTLMDLQMPEMNGLDALIAIRNEFPDAKSYRAYDLRG